MEPISGAALLAIIGATIAVSDMCKRTWAAIRGRTPEYEQRRAQDRKYGHELRMAKLQQWHAERMKGIAGPTVSEAVATRIRDWQRTTRDQMGPVRGYWWDWRQETVDRLARHRHDRQDRRDRGEAWWQRLYAAAAARAEQAWDERERERFKRTGPNPAGTPQPEPEPQRWTAERMDTAADSSSGPDAASDNTAPTSGPAPDTPPETVRAITEGIPEPLGGSPAEPTTSSDNSYGGTAMGHDPKVSPDTTIPPDVMKQFDRDLYGGLAQVLHPADRAKLNQADLRHPNARPAAQSGGASVASLNGETVDPESLGGFAAGMGQVASSMLASIEASIANLEARGVSGEPLDDLRQMADAAVLLASRSEGTAAAAARHADIQAVAQSDPSVGGEQYLGIGAARR